MRCVVSKFLAMAYQITMIRIKSQILMGLLLLIAILH
jgi:hypothetical protein